MKQQNLSAITNSLVILLDKLIMILVNKLIHYQLNAESGWKNETTKFNKLNYQPNSRAINQLGCNHHRCNCKQLEWIIFLSKSWLRKS